MSEKNVGKVIQIIGTVVDVEFESDNLGEHYKGKVRENFSQDDKIIMITSDRVSAFI